MDDRTGDESQVPPDGPPAGVPSSPSPPRPTGVPPQTGSVTEGTLPPSPPGGQYPPTWGTPPAPGVPTWGSPPSGPTATPGGWGAPGPGTPTGSPYAGGTPGGWGPPPGWGPAAPPYPVGPGGPPPLASWGIRLGGWLIDWLIFFLVDLVLNALFHGSKTGSLTFTVTTNGHVAYHRYSLLAALIGVVLVILYGGLLCGSQRGQTVGMMAVKVRAIDALAGGSIGTGRALWRALFEYLCFFFFFLPWVLDMLFPLWDPRRQTLHDKVSNTVVVRV